MSTLRLFTLLAWTFLPSLSLVAVGDYQLGPDSKPQVGVPRGKLVSFRWLSQVFPHTIRSISVYVPAQYNSNHPACVMFFANGHLFLYSSPSGDTFEVPAVFDNLIHKKEMPVTIGVFISPGVIPGEDESRTRSFEYDTLSNQYARFLLEEMWPELGKKYNLATNAASRAVCGSGSGGICAWTVAWERPDAFSKVIVFNGSFTNIRGGHIYPWLIRKTPPKPIRIFLQAGADGPDNEYGNWPLANQEMAAALKFSKYDCKSVFGEGWQNLKHGASIMPDVLRWLWRDYPVK